jgi:hypothetical protein
MLADLLSFLLSTSLGLLALWGFNLWQRRRAPAAPSRVGRVMKEIYYCDQCRMRITVLKQWVVEEEGTETAPQTH